MSSVASQRAMLIALGGVSIAALFVWYLQAKRGDIERKKKKCLLSDKSMQDNSLTSSSKDNFDVPDTADGFLAHSLKESDSTNSANNMGAIGPAGDNSELASKEEPPSKTLNANIIASAGDANVQPKLKSDELAETGSQNGSVGRSVSESDYDIDEQILCDKNNELLLDISHNPVEHEQFSWSEEMERSYVEHQQENDHIKLETNDRLANNESPGVASDNSEASSQDSGRATGGLASSLSPMDEGTDTLPMYEFEIPNTLVGLVIGIKGKTIKELSVRTSVKMLIRQHHTPEKVNTHQICQVRGKREEINKCLHMLRNRFPPARFPDLNLQPVLPPPLPHHVFDAMTTQPCWLTLPEMVPCEVTVSCGISPGHFFLQQPTHPSHSSLNQLDLYMLSLYSRGGQTIPELPKPCQTGLLCAAPVLNAWFRAVTHIYYEETDEVLVRFVDYGGYTTLPRSDLRQIRTDLMSLPFQATECYLAHVQPVDGTWNWSREAEDFFKSKCTNKVINATLVGTHADDKVNMVELTFTDDDGKVQRLDRLLMDAGLAKASDPSKLLRAAPYNKRPSLKPQSSVVLNA